MQKSKLKILLVVLSVFFIPTTSLAATFDSTKGTVVLSPNEYASKFMYAEPGSGGQQNFQFVYTKNDKGTYTMTQVFEGGRSADGKSATYTDKSDKYASVTGTYDGMKNLANAGIDTTHMENVSNLGLVKLSSDAVEQKGGDLVEQQLIANSFFTGIKNDTNVDIASVNAALDSKAFTGLAGDNQQSSGKLRDGSKDPTDTAGQAEQIKTTALTGGLALPENIGNATIGNALVSNRDVTYTNDGTKICGPTGCTYTLMAPIGSLLGDSSGRYIINKNDQRGLCSLLNSWFRIGIALAGMLAVVMIVLGGFQYATTDSLFDKEDGKGKIQNALWGLLLALTTWLIVSTVNPALANCTINANEVKLSAMSTTIYNSGALGGGILGLGMAANDIALQASIDARYKAITDQWTDADQEALLSDDPATSKAAADKWAGIQKQLDTLNNSFASKGGSFSGGSTSRDASWGSPDAGNMNGKTISGRQTYFSPNEKVTDSDTQAGNGAIGRLVEGTAGGKNALGQDLGTGDVIGSAGSVYYPAGTLVEINGIRYVVDDNNLKRNGDGTYVAKNPNVTNNFTVDIFTRNDQYVNTGSDTKKTMTVLYVPPTKVNTAAQLNDIRNNPGKYINR